MVVVTIMTRFP